MYKAVICCQDIIIDKTTKEQYVLAYNIAFGSYKTKKEAYKIAKSAKALLKQKDTNISLIVEADKDYSNQELEINSYISYDIDFEIFPSNLAPIDYSIDRLINNMWFECEDIPKREDLGDTMFLNCEGYTYKKN